MMKPKYPIYIISKGRYENGLRLTQEMLEKYGVPYRMVVEDSEFDAYAENVPEEKILAPVSYTHLTLPTTPYV